MIGGTRVQSTLHSWYDEVKDTPRCRGGGGWTVRDERYLVCGSRWLWPGK